VNRSVGEALLDAAHAARIQIVKALDAFMRALEEAKSPLAAATSRSKGRMRVEFIPVSLDPRSSEE
jgi:hypothetical protein